MSINRLWILGASDPEMERIEALLRAAGERVEHARTSERTEWIPCDYHRDDTHADAACPDCAAIPARVSAGEAYRMAPIEDAPWGGRIYLVECDCADPWPTDADGSPAEYRLVRRDGAPDDGTETDADYLRVHRVDHHRPGDPGHGRPPEDFLAASSIGQVVSHLARLDRLPSAWYRHGGYLGAVGAAGRTGKIAYSPVSGSWMVSDHHRAWRPIPADLVLAAASDHCPAAAYRGACPGVDPDALMRWRVRTRSAHQGRSESDILSDISRAMEVIRAAGLVVKSDGGAEVVDLREAPYVPELPEASLRLGVPILCRGLSGPDGRTKINILGDHAGDVVRAFLGGWAAEQGIADTYGDPARGFAGGYVA
jgi:hypothetical protein